MSHVIGEVAGITVGTYAAGAGKGQRIQIALPSGRDLTDLSPREAIDFANLVLRAGWDIRKSEIEASRETGAG